MGTKVRVTNLANQKSEIVTINDRGPFTKGRIIDVTIGTAEKLGFVKRGIVPVKVEVSRSAQFRQIASLISRRLSELHLCCLILEAS